MSLHTTAHAAPRVSAWRFPRLATLLLLALGALLTACAPSVTNDPVLAMRVNGQAITLSSYQQLLALFDASASLQGAGASGATAWQAPSDRQTWASAKTETVNFFTNTTIIEQQIAAQHITVTQKDVDAATAQLNAQIASARAQSASNPTNVGLKALVDAATPDAIRLLAIQQADTLLLASKGSVPTVKARGILLNSKSVAADTLNQVNHGADFATLAKARSLDATTGAAGGDLGTIYVGQFVAAFDTQVFKTMKGNGNIIVPLGTGYGVFQISGRSMSPLATLKNTQTQQQYLSSWVSNVLMPEAKVETYVS